MASVLFFLHLFIPYRDGNPSYVVVGKGQNAKLAARAGPATESIAEHIGRKTLGPILTVLPALLMCLLAMGSLSSKLAMSLARAAGVVAALVAIGTFSLAALMAVILVLGLTTTAISPFSSAFMSSVGISVGLMLFWAIASWAAWRSAKLPPDFSTAELKYLLCQASIVLSASPLIELYVAIDENSLRLVHTGPLWLGGISWCATLIATFTLVRYVRRTAAKSAGLNMHRSPQT